MKTSAETTFILDSVGFPCGPIFYTLPGVVAERIHPLFVFRASGGWVRFFISVTSL